MILSFWNPIRVHSSNMSFPIYFIVRSLGRPMCRWEDNIKMDLREIEFEAVDWIYLA